MGWVRSSRMLRSRDFTSSPKVQHLTLPHHERWRLHARHGEKARQLMQAVHVAEGKHRLRNHVAITILPLRPDHREGRTYRLPTASISSLLFS